MLNDKIFDWLPSDEKLNPYYSGIIEFVDQLVVLENHKKNYSSKEILDPCVGYVKLNSWEVAIIDTPLFQRLRKITQLGLAYQIYPTLRYSRLEHTIGVLGRLNQIIQKLKEKHRTKEREENEKIKLDDILDKYITQIRLAAIFHDVGHCIFSHVSESIIHELSGINKEEYYPSTREIIEIFNKKFASQDTDLTIAEIFSITILGVKKTAEVLINGNIDVYTSNESKKIRTGDDLSDYLHQSARFIAGLPIQNDARTVFLAQLISSGLDADKLDYMSREEHFSGIKIEMDLVRIFNKLKLFHISDENDLPKELIKYSKHLNEKNAHKDFIVLGIEKGGQFSYEEFCVARLALYEKIYLHKKVRAAEALLKKKLENLTKVDERYQKAHNWLYLVESITERKAYRLIEDSKAEIQLGLFEAYEKKLKPEIEIDFTDIESRNIPYRAFAFGPANAKTDNDLSRDVEFGGIEPNHLELDSIRFWNKLNPNRRFNPEKESTVNEFTQAIIDEAISILLKLKSISTDGDRRPGFVTLLLKKFGIDKKDKEFNLEKEQLFKKVNYKKLEEKLIVDVPDYRRVQLKYETLNFEEASYQTVRWTIPIDQIARYYQLHRILAYVYCEYEYSPLINIATERVAYKFIKNASLVFDQTQVISKEVFKIASELKKYLANHSNIYKGYEDLLLINENLVTVSAKRKITETMHNLNKLIYFDSKKLTYLDIEKFLIQFPENLQLPALNLINNIRVLPNEDLVSLIKSIIEKENSSVKAENGLGILPLGSYMSSSSNMMKSYRSFLSYHHIAQLNTNDKDMFLKVKHIIFVDDNINTGIQALNLMAKMLNADLKKLRDDKVILENIHKDGGEGDKGIDSEIINHIKNTPLTFIFITGHESSEASLHNYLTKYCDIEKKNINIKIKHILYDVDKFFTGRSINDEEQSRNKTLFRTIKEEFKHLPGDIAALKSFLEKVGVEVVKSRSIVQIYKQEPSENCLGYCNRESLVIFPSSVPTMTITALWCDGRYENDTKVWKSLIPRPKNNNK